MTETKFTPGPWVATEPDEFSDITINRGPDEPLAIAAVVNGVVRRMGGKSDEQKANAHLIAAAPKLYEMLARAATELERINMWGAQTVAEQARITLSKARGETE